jgi:two-component system, OmpR family, response regulator
MRVLVVYRNPIRAARLEACTRQQGHTVDALESLRAEETVLAAGDFDLVVLDLAGNDQLGLKTLHLLRARYPVLPILTLADSPSAQQRILALEAGADDCMAPDGTDEELAARMRVWARRSLGSAERLLRFGPLSYDSHARQAYLDGKLLRLSHRELCLLEVLIRRPGMFVSAQALLERLFEWSEEATLNAVQVYVYRLRRKVHHETLRIATARGLGYCLQVGREEVAR